MNRIPANFDNRNYLFKRKFALFAHCFPAVYLALIVVEHRPIAIETIPAPP